MSVKIQEDPEPEPQPRMGVYAYNPSCSGDRGKKINTLRPAPKCSVKPFLKTKIRTKGLGIWIKRKRFYSR
jgi:hypothetical protein